MLEYYPSLNNNQRMKIFSHKASIIYLANKLYIWYKKKSMFISNKKPITDPELESHDKKQPSEDLSPKKYERPNIKNQIKPKIPKAF